MSRSEFAKAWTEAVTKFMNGVISYEELMEFGTLDEYAEYMKDDPEETEVNPENVKVSNGD